MVVLQNWVVLLRQHLGINCLDAARLAADLVYPLVRHGQAAHHAGAWAVAKGWSGSEAARAAARAQISASSIAHIDQQLDDGQRCM